MSHEIKAGHCPVCHEKGEYYEEELYGDEDEHEYGKVHSCSPCGAVFVDLYPRDRNINEQVFCKDGQDEVKTFHAPDYKALYEELLAVAKAAVEDDTLWSDSRRVAGFKHFVSGKLCGRMNLADAISKGAKE